MIFAVAVFLWTSGDEPPPPEFHDIPAMPEELIISSDKREVAAIVADIVEESQISEDAPVVAVVTPAVDAVPVPADVAAAAPAEALRLQAGVFREKDNLYALEKKLRAAGFSTDVSEADGLFKLHILELADAAAVTAAEDTLSGILHEQGAAGNVVVQIGAFRRRERAEEIVEDLQRKGFDAWAETTDRNGERLLRVRVGGADGDQTRADAMRLELVKLGYEKARVIDLL